MPDTALKLEKAMPAATEAEDVILGAVLLDNALMQKCAETLEAEDFYSPRNRRVFGAMLRLHSACKSLNPHLIGEELKKTDSLEALGGVSAIANLSWGIPAFLNLDEYIEVVRDRANRRQLVRECHAIAEAALANDTDTKDVFTNAQARINDVCLRAEGGVGEYFVPLDRVIENDVIKALEDLRYGRTSKIKLGFPAIDSAMGGGLAMSDVLLVAADTGSGKSAFALQCAYQVAAQGIPTAFLAGEMSNKENVMRLLSQLSGITNLNWLTHITDSEYQFLVDWAMAIKAAPIHFEHRIADMQMLRTHLHSLVRRQKVKVLVIDYIQLFKMEKVDRRKRNERIAEASQEVKRLANELEIGIIEVAQFNREGAKSAQAGLHDLEGSGQLEKDASLIFILELGQVECSDDAGKRYLEAKVRLVKGRNVGKGEVYGKFYGRSVQFEF